MSTGTRRRAPSSSRRTCVWNARARRECAHATSTCIRRRQGPIAAAGRCRCCRRMRTGHRERPGHDPAGRLRTADRERRRLDRAGRLAERHRRRGRDARRPLLRRPGAEPGVTVEDGAKVLAEHAAGARVRRDARRAGQPRRPAVSAAESVPVFPRPGTARAPSASRRRSSAARKQAPEVRPADVASARTRCGRAHTRGPRHVVGQDRQLASVHPVRAPRCARAATRAVPPPRANMPEPGDAVDDRLVRRRLDLAEQRRDAPERVVVQTEQRDRARTFSIASRHQSPTSSWMISGPTSGEGPVVRTPARTRRGGSTAPRAPVRRRWLPALPKPAARNQTTVPAVGTAVATLATSHPNSSASHRLRGGDQKAGQRPTR